MSYATGAELSRLKRRGREYSIDDALDKTYLIRAITNKGRDVCGSLYLPKVLIGKRVKISLAAKEKRKAYHERTL